MIKDMVYKNRSCRRFYGDRAIDGDTLTGLVDLGRMAASGGNLQPLKYIISYTPERNGLVYEVLKWAAYLKDWQGPEPGERPAGYIIMLGDLDIAKSPHIDAGIAAENIMLGAVEAGLGGCMFRSFDRDALARSFRIPPKYEILMVLALGVPKETVVVEEAAPNGGIKYWRGGDGTHHVPKRLLTEILLEL